MPNTKAAIYYSAGNCIFEPEIKNDFNTQVVTSYSAEVKFYDAKDIPEEIKNSWDVWIEPNSKQSTSLIIESDISKTKCNISFCNREAEEKDRKNCKAWMQKNSEHEYTNVYIQ